MLVASWQLVFWRQWIVWSIRSHLRQDGSLVSPLFLSLTSNPRFGMLVDAFLFCNLYCTKVCCRLYLPDLQFRSLYHNYFLTQRFWASFLALWLVLWRLLCPWRRGLKIYLDKILGTCVSVSCNIVISFLAIPPTFPEQSNMR